MRKGLLVKEEGQESARVFRLSKAITRIGRSSTSEIMLQDNSISRKHAVIEKKDKKYVLIDNNSRNTTRVNGVAVARRTLREGDRIGFGNVEMVFHEVEENTEEFPSEKRGEAEDSSDATVFPDETSYISSPNMCTYPEVRAINGWQIVRPFGSCRRGDEEVIIRTTVEDLSGIQSVRRVVLYIDRSGTHQKARWIKAGASSSRTGVLFPEERIIEVAETGVGSPPHINEPGGSWVVDETEIDAICVPLAAGDISRGALYVEGDAFLPKDAIYGALAAAEAMGLGLLLMLSANGEDGVAPAHSDNVEIIGRSSALQQSVKTAVRAGRTDSTVLICGESGTGKELFARLIHSESQRSRVPLVTVHSSAIEETLLGSTLFGHEKGAFTGAVGKKRGLFEDADHGTIFLDEIGEMSPLMQIKLLRVLQEGDFMRVGGNDPIHIDTRVIAATNRDLAAAVREGTFREDLYYRFKVIDLTLPPLRARKEDIGELVHHFVSELGNQLETRVTKVSEEALTALKKYAWPGNVRELRNVVERALVLADGPCMELVDLPREIATSCASGVEANEKGPGSDNMRLRDVERQHIQHVLGECDGNKRTAAHRLGISRSTLYEKLKDS